MVIQKPLQPKHGTVPLPKHASEGWPRLEGEMHDQWCKTPKRKNKTTRSIYAPRFQQPGKRGFVFKGTNWR